MPSHYHVAFWNLENLFDIEHAPGRTDKLERAIGADLVGWTQALLDGKIAQLASIIRQMSGGQGPDVLGVCEVENERVIRALANAAAAPGRTYDVVHHDAPDQRGIDVAFLYDPARLTPTEVFSHAVMRRTATRDLLQVNFRTASGKSLVLVGNHWPSRSGGELESAVYRAVAGETLAYFHERIFEVLGEDTPVLAMGDFNDEPSDASLAGYALSSRSRTKVLKATNPRFFNLMWPLMGQGLGSFYFDNFPNLLDQFLANKNLLKPGSPIRALAESAVLYRFPEMVATGLYPRPIPYGGMPISKKPINPNGFSDHFPIGVTLEE
ncbi:MAG: endonuclease/exonuclease/phosphatase family protein [Chloroflexota bacterium]